MEPFKGPVNDVTWKRCSSVTFPPVSSGKLSELLSEIRGFVVERKSSSSFLHLRVCCGFFLFFFAHLLLFSSCIKGANSRFFFHRLPPHRRQSREAPHFKASLELIICKIPSAKLRQLVQFYCRETIKTTSAQGKKKKRKNRYRGGKMIYS